MLIDQILYPVESLGPGKRIAIWVVGCTHQCEGCSNPELWEASGQKPITPVQLFAAISQIAAQFPVDGITITGGEPMNQAEDLLELVRLLKGITNDILVFTGYLHKQLLQCDVRRDVLNEIAVLVDGPYIKELNSSLPMRGSSNQQILLFDLELEERYKSYLHTDKRRIQNFYFADQSVSVGIHANDFQSELDALLKEMEVRRISNESSEVAQ